MEGIAPARTPWKWALLVGVAAFLLYAPSFGHRFTHLDDPNYVPSNGAVCMGLTAEGAKWAFTTFHAANWHPLTWLSHMADVELFGTEPRGHHVVNALFHGLNGALLLLLLARGTGRLPESLLAALLFAFHPLRVESVSWVAERKDLLSAFFCFLSAHAYLSWARSGGAGRYLAVLLAFAMALLSKPMAVTLPLVLLLLDYWPLGRLPDPADGRGAFLSALGSRLLEKVPLLLLSAASSAVTVVAQRRGSAMMDLQVLPLPERLGNALIAYAEYLGLTLWPSGLSAYYPHALKGVRPAAAAAALLLLAALTAGALLARRRAPSLPVGWLWFLGTLVPVIGLVQVGSQAMADRYTYLPHAGLFAGAVFGASALLPGRGAARRGAFAAGLAAALLLGGASVVQQRYWKDTATLFGRALETTGEGNAFAHVLLGVAELDAKRPEAAIAHFRTAVRTSPRYRDGHYNLGLALASLDRQEEAEVAYRAALACDPTRPWIHVSLAKALAKLGREGEAEAHLREALRLRPDWSGALEVAAALRSARGDEEGALPFLRAAVRRDPFNATARGNLGAALARRGRLDEAIPLLHGAVRISPADGGMRYNLGAALEEKGRLEEASGQLAEAARLEGDNVAVLSAHGRVLARRRLLAEAGPVLERAVALAPGDVDALFPLAMVRAGEGRTEEARRLFGEVLRRSPGHEGARQGLAMLGGGGGASPPPRRGG